MVVRDDMGEVVVTLVLVVMTWMRFHVIVADSVVWNHEPRNRQVVQGLQD